MTPSMVRSMVTALEELGVPARSRDLSAIADTLERLYRERDMLRAMLDRAFDEYIGQGDEPESLLESQAALMDYESRRAAQSSGKAEGNK